MNISTCKSVITGAISISHSLPPPPPPTGCRGPLFCEPTICCSKLSEQYGFSTYSKTVKYVHKVVSAPKKSILKFNGLSNIHIFKFAFDCLFSHHTVSKTHKIHSFIIPRGSVPLDPLGGLCLWRTFGRSQSLLDRTLLQRKLPTGL